ncbi:MAG: EAL domain-containing protein [Sulfuricella sp.]
MSMYRQLWLAVIVSTLLALIGSLLGSTLGARVYLQEQLQMKNMDNAAVLALSLGQTNTDAIGIELAVSALFDSGHYEFIRVVDPLGKTIVERQAPTGQHEAPEWFVRLLPISPTPGQAQISSGWKQLGTVTLASHSRFAYRSLWRSVIGLISVLGVAGLFSGYLATLILRRLRVPLNTVISQAQAIAERRFVTSEVPRVPELRQLAEAMNVAVERLKFMFDEEAARLEAVRQEANSDALTGLANRSHFMATLRQALEAEDAHGGSLLLIRLANLAGVNQHIGRDATDQWLHGIGAVLQAAAGKKGAAARLNGADFALLLPEHDGNTRDFVARLLASLTRESEPYVKEAAAAYIGFGGFVPNTDLAALLSRTDAALASAESAGISGMAEAVQDDEAMPRSGEQWEQTIRRALASNWVRLVSFPVKRLDGSLSHRECPLRLMFDAEGEWLPAGRFLPIAERLKLTPELDLAAIGLGLKELEQNPQLAGLAINLSGSSIESVKFRDSVRALLRAYPKSAPRLWLEIPEAGALQHFDSFRLLCRDLQDAGCIAGIEHFGRQFSQIGLLHGLGLDYIKVDASFIRGIESNPGNQTFLKGLSAIAHGIGMLVFAEGVVSEAELNALSQLGFDGATGPAIKDVAA